MPRIHNNTDFTLDVINKLPIIGRTVNNWMQRNILLREHPDSPGRLISIGTTFDGLMSVVCDDPRDNWATALDYIAHGKVYVRE